MNYKKKKKKGKAISQHLGRNLHQICFYQGLINARSNQFRARNTTGGGDQPEFAVLFHRSFLLEISKSSAKDDCNVLLQPNLIFARM